MRIFHEDVHAELLQEVDAHVEKLEMLHKRTRRTAKDSTEKQNQQTAARESERQWKWIQCRGVPWTSDQRCKRQTAPRSNSPQTQKQCKWKTMRRIQRTNWSPANSMNWKQNNKQLHDNEVEQVEVRDNPAMNSRSNGQKEMKKQKYSLDMKNLLFNFYWN